MEKSQKIVLKQLRNFLSENYTTCAEKFLTNYLTEEDLILYMENEQTIAQRIASIKKMLEDEELANQMKELKNGEPIELCIEKYEKKLKLLKLRFEQVLNLEINTTEEINEKEKEIETVKDQIKRTEKALESMRLIKQETEPPKRKPGRPKKK